jgi:tryptophan synthase alpha chain
MTRIQELFDKKSTHVLNVYCTAGYPRLDSTIPVMSALAKNGADMIELGMPYSDPLADGPVIQHSSSVAIANGMSVDKLFEQLKDFRKNQGLENIPVILMGYMNPVLLYGFEKFCSDASLLGIDGLILPDMPVHEYQDKYRSILKRFNLDFTFLVTPETGRERLKVLDELSSGFLYAVSSSSTTGNNNEFAAVAYLENLRSCGLKNPVLVGFGIHDRKSFEYVCQYVNGAIIGSAFIKSLESTGTIENSVKQFLRTVLPPA